MADPQPRTVPDRPVVAIIMRSKNEQPYTEPALQMLERQTYTNYVLYNVDSGSTDGTLDVVRKHNPCPDRVIEIPPKAYVPGTVLNDMIARTTEPIIVFLNADAIPQDEWWLERLLEPILTGKADATMSRQVARPTALFVVRYDYDRAYNTARFKGGRNDFFSAVACAFKRELWEATRFYEEGYGEDLAWSKACQDKGARFQFVADSVVEHSHDYTLKGLYQKRYRHGIAFVYIYGEGPKLARECYQWFRETVRDTLYALRTLRIDTIPYNLVYRAIIYVAYHRGRLEGMRRFKQKT